MIQILFVKVKYFPFLSKWKTHRCAQLISDIAFKLLRNVTQEHFNDKRCWIFSKLKGINLPSTRISSLLPFWKEAMRYTNHYPYLQCLLVKFINELRKIFKLSLFSLRFRKAFQLCSSLRVNRNKYSVDVNIPLFYNQSDNIVIL